MIRKLVPLLVALAAFVAAAASADAAPAGQLCPSFKSNGLTFRWETAGTGWTCGSAKPWVVKLSGDRIASVGGNVKLTNGPAGFHCWGTIAKKGFAAGGACFKGTWAYPKSGFTWNGF